MLFPFMSFVFKFPLTSCYLLPLSCGFPLCFLFCLSSCAACFSLSPSPTSVCLPGVILLSHVLFCALPPAAFPIALTCTGLLSLSCGGRPAQYKDWILAVVKALLAILFLSFLKVNMNNKKTYIHPVLLKMTPLKSEFNLWLHCISCD